MTAAVYTSGSTMGHIVKLTGAVSIGLVSLFLADLADIYFLSLLGEAELAAAVGYAGSILFFTTSICLGIAIATAALVARALGAGDRPQALMHTTNACLFGVALTAAAAVAIWLAAPWILGLLGAEGRTHGLAESYLRIIVPSMPVLVLAMCAGGVLRAVGDARRSTYATVSGGAANALLDPLFIFGLGMGIEGAAVASVLARVVILAIALHGMVWVHRFHARFDWILFRRHLGAVARIAFPAILTSAATPIGNAYVIAAASEFGDGAVAGLSIIGRIIPVAFAAILALSAAVGPVIGQNFGAGRFERVRGALTNALVFAALYVLAVCLLLLLFREAVVGAFSASGEALALVAFFCTWISWAFLFNGALFAANAAFNNLGRASYSTFFNFGRATIGTIPFVYLGGKWAGAAGILAGQALGAVIFGVISILAAFALIRRLAEDGGEGPSPPRRLYRSLWPIPAWPQSSVRT